MVNLTCKFWSTRIKSASQPGASLPLWSSTWMARAAFSEEHGISSAMDRLVALTKLAKARSMVRVEPASVPSARRTAPSLSVTGMPSNVYSPSGKPVALIESVMRMTPSGPLILQQESHHNRVNVDVIGNELALDLFQVEGCPDDAGFAMIQRAHGIEAVGYLARPQDNCSFHFSVSRIGVPGGYGDTAAVAHSRSATGFRGFREPTATRWIMSVFRYSSASSLIGRCGSVSYPAHRNRLHSARDLRGGAPRILAPFSLPMTERVTSSASGWPTWSRPGRG